LHYLVDAHNLLFHLADEDVDSIERSRQDLIDRLAAKLEARRFSVTLVFDSGKTHIANYPGHSKQGRIKIMFSPVGISADDYIIELLSNCHVKSTTVVTSDSHLAHLCRDLGAHTLPVEKFMALLHKRRLNSGSMAKPELGNPEYDEYLRKIFEDKS